MNKRAAESQLRGGENGSTATGSQSHYSEGERRMEKYLAVELLERLLKDKIRSQTRPNLVQEKKYSHRLIEALRKYHNRMIESSQVINQLDKNVEEVIEDEEDISAKESAKSKWAELPKRVGPNPHTLCRAKQRRNGWKRLPGIWWTTTKRGRACWKARRWGDGVPSDQQGRI